MYSPRYNREDDPAALLAFMRSNIFATLLSNGEGGLMATHLPILSVEEDGSITLEAHMAKANRQWHDFTPGREVMAVFQGPHAYISPAAYVAGPNVPTWNYTAVHAYGVPQIVNGEAKEEMVRRLILALEPAYLAAYEAIPRDWVEARLDAIVAFTIPLVRLESRFKLSQDRAPSDRDSVIADLESRENLLAHEVAALMRGAGHA